MNDYFKAELEKAAENKVIRRRIISLAARSGIERERAEKAVKSAESALSKLKQSWIVSDDVVGV